MPGQLDLLLGNGAVYGTRSRSFRPVDEDDLRDAFDVNALGVVRMVNIFLPHLTTAPRPRILAVTSLMGTLSHPGTGCLADRMTKAAMNMAMQVMTAKLGPQGIGVACLRPGWVRTSMGGEDGTLSRAEGALGLLVVADALTPAPTAQLFDVDGRPLPW